MKGLELEYDTPTTFPRAENLALVSMTAGREMTDGYERVYAVINRIPKGRVATYGQIARLADIRGQARRVGYALSALSDHRRVAWPSRGSSRG